MFHYIDLKLDALDEWMTRRLGRWLRLAVSLSVDIAAGIIGVLAIVGAHL